MSRPPLNANPPSNDDFKFFALTDTRAGALLHPSISLPNTIPIIDGRKILVGEHQKTNETLVTVAWQRVTAASVIWPESTGMPYHYARGFSEYKLAQHGLNAGASSDHEFNVIPHGARTMIVLEGHVRLCVRESLRAILSNNAVWTSSDTGVRGLLLRAAQDSKNEISLRSSVTRKALTHYWAGWRESKLES